MLKKRVLTSAILLPVIILMILFLPSFYFAIICALIIAFCAWEWSLLIGYKSQSLRILYVIVVLLVLIYVNRLIPFDWNSFYVYLGGIFAIIWSFFAILRYQFSRHAYALGFQYSQVKFILGIFVLISFWVALISIKGVMLLMALFVIWAADIAAYFIGRRFGKHRLIPKVSPNKTWEGMIAGLMAGLIVCIICSYILLFSNQERFFLWGIGFVAILFSMVGDLMVSLLKRLIGVKDTGKLLPGHGGILDRVDSLMAGVIIFAMGFFIIQIFFVLYD